MPTAYQRARGSSNPITPPTDRQLATNPPARTGPYASSFAKVTRQQFLVPVPAHGQSRDENNLTNREWRFMGALEIWGVDGVDCRTSKLEIGRRLGLTGSEKSIKRCVGLLLHGRKGERGWRGLIERGWVEILDDSNEGYGLLLRRSAKWKEYGLPKVFRDDARVPAVESTAPPATSPSCPAAAVVEPAAIAAAEVVGIDQAEAAKVLPVVLGEYARDYPCDEQARLLVQMLQRSDWRLELQPDGMVKPINRHPQHEPLSAEVCTALRLLKPQIVDLLKREQPVATIKDEEEKPAPRVKARNELRGMVGRLTRQPAEDDSGCEAFAQMLIDDPGFAHNDQDPALSFATFAGWARAVKKGELAEGALQDAFEAACGSKVCNRGATMVATMKRLIGNGRAGKDDSQG